MRNYPLAEWRALLTNAPLDPGAIMKGLRAAVDEAEGFVQRMPTDKMGLVFLDCGQVVLPDPAGSTVIKPTRRNVEITGPPAARSHAPCWTFTASAPRSDPQALLRSPVPLHYSRQVILEQFYLGCLAHASYLIGSEGMAAVVDPQRDVGVYLEAAAKLGVRIAYIIETHLHADFVSGHQELAQRTGAMICLGEAAGATFPHRALRDGDEIGFGKCRLRVAETPGHTVESISIVVTDLEQGDSPYAVLTGDTLFIGDVGRPDLSETRTPQELAGMLYDSLHGKLLVLPDDVRVYPAHGAGSMCGRNISADRTSTIGRERLTNYALQPMSRAQFVGLVTEDLPPRPEYFQRDVEANRRGAPVLESLPPVKPLAAAEVIGRQQEGVTVLDTRAATYFCAGHVPGSINIGLGGQFAAWAGSVLGLDRDLILVAEDDSAVEEARLRLARVGIERVTGKLEDGIMGWVRAGLPLAEIHQITVQDLRAEMDKDPGLIVVDVRRQSEWNQGHIPGAVLRPLDQFRSGMESLDRARPAAVHCKGGYRSAIACSLLQAHGFQRVMNVLGGFDAWTGVGMAAAT